MGISKRHNRGSGMQAGFARAVSHSAHKVPHHFGTRLH